MKAAIFWRFISPHPHIIFFLSDFFFQKADKGYRRLTPNQPVGLRHAGYAIAVSKVEKNENGQVVNVICKCIEIEKVETKPKAFIHWVSEPEEIEVRLYSPL